MDLKIVAEILRVKIPKKFAFLRNGIQLIKFVEPKTITVSGSIAGNDEKIVTVEKNKKYKLKELAYVLVADATVQNRYMYLQRQNYVSTYDPYLFTSAVTTASQTGYFTVNSLNQKDGSCYVGAGDNKGHIGLAFPLEILSEDQLRIYVGGGQAGDILYYKLVFEEVEQN